ncbi:TPA: hypothetical protein QDB15_002626 [Burkholderia vietnamiensis]|uniref:transcriptional regulator domain-containing protein n=1 Tax=Burkholderia vietnamiensis TaxID=60552 RepID=UPI001592CF6C|nr:hypothetical protein [Burkholderia vietnamiensis]MCA8207190.1 hypothetical protein [Burkholderia vietnamiensis]HDR9097060.1 hypothetical protein [Burkholderia vietnamiensis]HDR9118842.1 hypothetical protein [Burkholderia vietnamiensis]HDR9170451.1 hypothetical protein [Burkholderia vietnamiensis]HDR9279619.1 hypothetical protein [Burkholderia vietnamiensis]
MSQPKRVPLPDGSNDSDYEGCKDWDYRRWAWEYLRRNLDFREACCEASKIKDKSERIALKAKIAREFMLRRYWHCDRPCKDGKPPVFRAVMRSPLPQALGEAEWSVNLNHDQVAIVFNLRPALHSRSAIKALLGNAERILKQRLERLQALEPGHNLHATPQLDKTKHTRNLRLLDAKAAGCRPIDIARAKWYAGEDGTPKPLLADAVSKLIREAEKLTKFGYMGIVTSQNRRGKLPVRRS